MESTEPWRVAQGVLPPGADSSGQWRASGSICIPGPSPGAHFSFCQGASPRAPRTLGPAPQTHLALQPPGARGLFLVLYLGSFSPFL